MCNIDNISRVSHIFQLFDEHSEIIAKYAKRGKYSPTFHEATCDNYLIVNFLLKSNMGRVVLLIDRACVVQCKTNFFQKTRRKKCKY